MISKRKVIYVIFHNRHLLQSRTLVYNLPTPEVFLAEVLLFSYTCQ